MTNPTQKTFAKTPVIIQLAPPAGEHYKISELFDKARDMSAPVKFVLTKALEDAHGRIVPIKDVSDQSVEAELILNGAINRNGFGTVAIFAGYTCAPVTLPGRSLRLSLLDDDGKDTGVKQDDNVVLSGDSTYVSLIFDEASQSGWLTRISNATYDIVELGSMLGVMTIDDRIPQRDVILTRPPILCLAEVDENGINP